MLFRVFFCYIFKHSGKFTLQTELEKDFFFHISSSLKELVKQKLEEVNVLNKEEGPNVDYFSLYFIVLLDFCVYYVVEKIIL